MHPQERIATDALVVRVAPSRAPSSPRVRRFREYAKPVRARTRRHQGGRGEGVRLQTSECSWKWSGVEGNPVSIGKGPLFNEAFLPNRLGSPTSGQNPYSPTLQRPFAHALEAPNCLSLVADIAQALEPAPHLSAHHRQLAFGQRARVQPGGELEGQLLHHIRVLGGEVVFFGGIGA